MEHFKGRGAVLSLKDLLPNGLDVTGPDRPLPLTFRVDSRAVEPGDGFAAFQGESTDGHLYIESALARGASVVLAERGRVSEKLPAQWPQVTFIFGHRSETALAELARAYLVRLPDLKHVAAVTGSVGKTTTRSFLARIMSASQRTHAASGNYNTLIGCSVAVLSAPFDVQCLVLEMGANHPGEIAQMVSFFPPTAAAITEVAPAHLEGFGSVQGVLREKAGIFGGGRLKDAVLNADNPLLAELASQINTPVTTFGRDGSLSFEDDRLEWDEGFKVSARLCYSGDRVPVSVRLSGKHGLYPLCCALALAVRMGVPFRQAVREAVSFESLPGRGEVVRLQNGAFLIDESYNASPKSMTAAIQSLGEVQIRGRKFALLGSMGELGAGASAAHQQVMEVARGQGFDWWGAYGSDWQSGAKATDNLLTDWEEVRRAVAGLNLRSGDVLLVKGSHACGLERLVKELKGQEAGGR